MNTNAASSIEQQQQAIREEYRRQAATWGKAKVNKYLEWVVEQLELTPQTRVLDVAAGTGLFSQSVAPKVAHVTATDITPEMLEQGRQQARDHNINNITFQQAAGESLPFADESFDLVISRYSVHHFLKPVEVIRQMGRVCKRSGSVVVLDMVANENPELAARQNHYETVVDATHTRILSPSQLVRECTDAGLTVKKYLSIEVPMVFDIWQAFLPKDAEPRLIVRAALEKELAGQSAPTGFRPFVDAEGQLTFLHTWGLAVCRRT